MDLNRDRFHAPKDNRDGHGHADLPAVFPLVLEDQLDARGEEPAEQLGVKRDRAELCA